MLNKIWPIFIVISIIFSFFSGNIEKVNNAVFESTENAISVTITLLGTMCLWSGIMNIASNLSLIDKLCNAITPIISFLFPDIKSSKKIKKEISMNIIANFLGLGNAATPLGLKAMNSMQKQNTDKKYMSKSMKMFILINTASIQLIPTTIFAIRKSLGSSNPTIILIPVWCTTLCSAIGGITCLKKLLKRKK